MSRNSRKCEICSKSEYGKYKAKLFYATFPLNEDRCREWLRLVGKPELVHLPIEKLNTSRYLCADHFERKAMNRMGNRLKKTAVPKLHLLSTPLTSEQLSEFPQHVWNFNKALRAPDSRQVDKPSNFSHVRRKDSTEAEGVKPQLKTLHLFDDPEGTVLTQDDFEDTFIDPGDQIETTVQDNHENLVAVTEDNIEPTGHLHSNVIDVEDQDKAEPENNCDLLLYEDENSGGLDKNETKHHGFKCNQCHSDIEGFRYVCVECPDFDLCSACEARGVHDTHYVLRIPAPRPQSEIQEVVRLIREELQQIIDNDKASIKDEIETEDEILLEDVTSKEAANPDPLDIYNTPVTVTSQQLPRIFNATIQKPNLLVTPDLEIQSESVKVTLPQDRPAASEVNPSVKIKDRVLIKLKTTNASSNAKLISQSFLLPGQGSPTNFQDVRNKKNNNIAFKCFRSTETKKKVLVSTEMILNKNYSLAIMNPQKIYSQSVVLNKSLGDASVGPQTFTVLSVDEQNTTEQQSLKPQVIKGYGIQQKRVKESIQSSVEPETCNVQSECIIEQDIMEKQLVKPQITKVYGIKKRVKESVVPETYNVQSECINEQDIMEKRVKPQITKVYGVKKRGKESMWSSVLPEACNVQSERINDQNTLEQKLVEPQVTEVLVQQKRVKERTRFRIKRMKIETSSGTMTSEHVVKTMFDQNRVLTVNLRRLKQL